LAAQAAAPGSPLACLDAVAGDSVESACEKQVFASPASVAAATSYVAARLALLGDTVAFTRRTGAHYDVGVATLRLGLEADRYGIVAHVLSVRDSCTPLLCDSYALLKDSERVQANLRERLFDHYVDRYAPEWAAHAQPAGQPVAAAAPGSAYATASAPGTPVPSKYDFPSAASIPPVSIMTPEPGMPAESKTAPASVATTAPPAAPAAPAHRAVRAHPPPRAAAASPRPAVAPPQQITPQPIAPTLATPGATLH
jgi:hypothetical protein